MKSHNGTFAWDMAWLFGIGEGPVWGEIINNKARGYTIIRSTRATPGQGRMPTPPSIIHLSTLTFLPSLWVGGLGTYLGLSFCCPFNLLGGLQFWWETLTTRWRNRTPVPDDVATGLRPDSESPKMGSE